ncbi:GNAT family N-acetyltransferase [Teredinibacter turnerae]|uniref:GNAT family N-acetyltransferase n=1 Tax=Teredinibacter turnerae TaxID=2426 RepID=UPI00048F2F96|nr:GNAT family N-acetyltransferase [Teredinibacter turnerae]
MEIREAEISDMENICTLSIQINHQHHMSLPHIFKRPESLEQDAPYWERYLNDENGIIYVALKNSQIVGAICGNVFLNNSMPFLVERLRCCIGTIVVAENHQRLGLGTLLMKTIENWAKSKGAKTIDLHVMQFNEGAYDLYKKLGYSFLSQNMAKEI